MVQIGPDRSSIETDCATGNTTDTVGDAMTTRSLGIDLASQAVKTAACVITWSGTDTDTEPVATAACPRLGLTDRDLLDLAAECDAIGIDAPFGWPDPFVAFLDPRETDGEPAPVWTTHRRDALRFRATDFRVRETLRRWPLSVSTDRIALASMRCAGLLAHLGVTDRSGDGRVFEVYPAAALHAWCFAHRGYKPREGSTLRQNPPLAALLDSLLARCGWLRLDAEALDLCARNDDAFDALIASLVARAAARGRTLRPSPDEMARARREGWIAVPEAGSLDRLP